MTGFNNYNPKFKRDSNLKDISDLYPKVIDKIREENKISQKLLKESFGVSVHTAVRLIDKLRLDGIIRPSTNGKHEVVTIKE